jgi:PLP dependent protein
MVVYISTVAMQVSCHTAQATNRADGGNLMRPAIDGVTPTSIQQGLARVRETIAEAAARSGRDAADVHVLAAVKYVDAAACAHLVDAGVADLAESRLAQLVDRQDSGLVPAAAAWHFIGRIQSREAAAVAERVRTIHTLCTESAAKRIATGTARPELFVQVNVDRDPAKDGLAPEDVERFLVELPAELEVRGFMAMPAFTDNPEQSRGAFAALRELHDELAPRVAGRHRLGALSIGTSQDFAVAIEEGATHVRLGRTLYGGDE